MTWCWTAKAWCSTNYLLVLAFSACLVLLSGSSVMIYMGMYPTELTRSYNCPTVCEIQSIEYDPATTCLHLNRPSSPGLIYHMASCTSILDKNIIKPYESCDVMAVGDHPLLFMDHNPQTDKCDIRTTEKDMTENGLFDKEMRWDYAKELWENGVMLCTFSVVGLIFCMVMCGFFVKWNKCRCRRQESTNHHHAEFHHSDGKNRLGLGQYSQGQYSHL